MGGGSSGWADASADVAVRACDACGVVAFRPAQSLPCRAPCLAAPPSRRVVDDLVRKRCDHLSLLRGVGDGHAASSRAWRFCAIAVAGRLGASAMVDHLGAVRWSITFGAVRWSRTTGAGLARWSRTVTTLGARWSRTVTTLGARWSRTVTTLGARWSRTVTTLGARWSRTTGADPRDLANASPDAPTAAAVSAAAIDSTTEVRIGIAPLIITAEKCCVCADKWRRVARVASIDRLMRPALKAM